MPARIVFEQGDKVIFNKIENYKITIETRIVRTIKIESNNTIKYEDQGNELVGTVVNILNDYYTIEYIAVDVTGRLRRDVPILLNVKISDVRELSN